MRNFLNAAFLACLLGSPAIAQAQGRESGPASVMKSTCQPDYRAHCSGRDPAPPIEAACLAQFYINLSKNCQMALDAYNAPPSEASDSQ